MRPLWIIGCGDIGCRVAALHIRDNAYGTSSAIHALVRSEGSAKRIHSRFNDQVKTHCVDLDFATFREDLNGHDVFYFAPPPQQGRQDLRLQRFLQGLQGQPKRIVLISTTGVYGDNNGAWLDETAPTQPQAERAFRRLDAEQLLSTWANQHGVDYVILRVAGIYAADRLPLARLKKAMPVLNAEEAGWTNRIHADDLARICQQVMQDAPSGQIYNACDGHPSSMTEYFNQVADAVGLARPPQISMTEAEHMLSAGMLSYLRESRRISNRKLLQTLNFKLHYPKLSTGLAEFSFEEG